MLGRSILRACRVPSGAGTSALCEESGHDRLRSPARERQRHHDAAWAAMDEMDRPGHELIAAPLVPGEFMSLLRRAVTTSSLQAPEANAIFECEMSRRLPMRHVPNSARMQAVLTRSARTHERSGALAGLLRCQPLADSARFVVHKDAAPVLRRESSPFCLMSNAHPSVESVARMLGVTVDRVRLELARAIRRSEPDTREVHAVIRGRRVVARRSPDGEWRVAVEARRPAWES